jgi:hypothetical protein
MKPVLCSCWAQAHFVEKELHGGNIVGREACESLIQEDGKERQMVVKVGDERKACMQRRKACKANMQEELTMLGFS